MKRAIVLLLSVVLFAAIAATVTAIVVIKEETGRVVALPGRTVVEIQPGQNLRSIARQLSAAGLIHSERVFLWVAAREGVDRNIKYGRHEFEGEVTLVSVVRELGRAPKPILRVTIPEGLTVRDVAALLERSGAVPAASYLAVACSPELRSLVGAPAGASCAEGFLFPDTYDLVPGMSAGQIVDLQVGRFHEVLDPLLAAGPQPPAPPSMSVGEIVTLASIVEKETAVPEERPRIAAVFYNRLRSGMPLQTDPTVIYGVIDSGAAWDGNLTRAQLGTATPYNTYMKRGLPPGPICNPGRASIAAVLRPATSAEYYFVSRGDGSHEFNSDLAAHNRAVRRYQLRGVPDTNATEKSAARN